MFHNRYLFEYSSLNCQFTLFRLLILKCHISCTLPVLYQYFLTLSESTHCRTGLYYVTRINNRRLLRKFYSKFICQWNDATLIYTYDKRMNFIYTVDNQHNPLPVALTGGLQRYCKITETRCIGRGCSWVGEGSYPWTNPTCSVIGGG